MSMTKFQKQSRRVDWKGWHKENPCEHKFRCHGLGGSGTHVCRQTELTCSKTLLTGKCPEGRVVTKPEPEPSFKEIRAVDALNTRLKRCEDRLDRMERFFL